jgi:hypothetical protein
MATNTYVALQTQTLASAASSVTFNSIPQGYTDLVLVTSTQSNISSGSDDINVVINSDSTTGHYSMTYLYGTGSSAVSSRTAGRIGIGRHDSTEFAVGVTHFQNYSNTTTYKTVLSRGSAASQITIAYVGLWQSTSAINQLVLSPSSASTFSVGSTFSLYGVAAAGTNPAAKATGGVIYQDATYTYHAFASSGTFTPSQALTADVLVVAGGGGGGNTSSGNNGGGGAGGLIYAASQSLSSGTGYTCTIGGGGAVSTNGGNSSFTGLTTAVGGGAGGVASSGGSNGSNGGSGGGGAVYNPSPVGSGGTGSQGNNGGSGYGSPSFAGGGGGGYGTAGSSATASIGGNGGNGTNTYSSWLTSTGFGSSGYIAAGGAGSGSDGFPAGTGGLGGGGIGASYYSTQYATAGLTNSGSGGGGGVYRVGSYSAGAGGSGLVIVRYAN